MARGGGWRAVRGAERIEVLFPAVFPLMLENESKSFAGLWPKRESIKQGSYLNGGELKVYTCVTSSRCQSVRYRGEGGGAIMGVGVKLMRNFSSAAPLESNNAHDGCMDGCGSAGALLVQPACCKNTRRFWAHCAHSQSAKYFPFVF